MSQFSKCHFAALSSMRDGKRVRQQTNRKFEYFYLKKESSKPKRDICLSKHHICCKLYYTSLDTGTVYLSHHRSYEINCYRMSGRKNGLRTNIV